MQNLKSAIVSSVDFIEKHINEKITLDDISLYAGISKYYLLKTFKALTGQAIIEYTKSRKLTASIDDLVHTSKRIIDIAMDYGFDYEQSYIRAFRKEFGCTPMKIRIMPISLNITEKLNIADLMSVDHSLTYQPRFVFMQKFYLIGESHVIASKSGVRTANSFGRQFFYSDKYKIQNIENEHAYFGYTDWSRGKEGFITYVPSTRVPNLEFIPSDMKGIEIPAHKYVVFKFVGWFNPDQINGRHVGRLLVQLYRKWIFGSGYQFAAPYRFEYIDTAISKDNYCELELYQPIQSFV